MSNPKPSLSARVVSSSACVRTDFVTRLAEPTLQRSAHRADATQPRLRTVRGVFNQAQGQVRALDALLDEMATTGTISRADAVYLAEVTSRMMANRGTALRVRFDRCWRTADGSAPERRVA
jgi:hypothetical protein